MIKSTFMFSFLAKKVNTFSKSVQDWMEDEVMRIYMEAKRKEQLQANTQNGVANFQSYQPTFIAGQDSGLRYCKI